MGEDSDEATDFAFVVTVDGDPARAIAFAPDPAGPDDGRVHALIVGEDAVRPVSFPRDGGLYAIIRGEATGHDSGEA